MMAKLSLFFCLFFNPCGYDAIFKMVLDATGDYWTTVRVFYLVAGLFLGLHFYFSKVNPFVSIYKCTKNLLKKIKIIVDNK